MSKLTAKQKQKQKLRQRQRQLRNPTLLAYHGNKYRTEALTRPLMEAEIGIFQADAISGRRLTDRDVQQRLAAFIEMLRHGALEPIDTEGPLLIDEVQEADSMIELIRGNWQRYFADHPHPGRDNLIGVLRTILGSIERHRSSNARGYLDFLAGFLGKLGVRVRVESSPTPALE